MGVLNYISAQGWGAYFLTENEPECRILTNNFIWVLPSDPRGGRGTLPPAPSAYPPTCFLIPQYFRRSAATVYNPSHGSGTGNDLLGMGTNRNDTVPRISRLRPSSVILRLYWASFSLFFFGWASLLIIVFVWDLLHVGATMRWKSLFA